MGKMDEQLTKTVTQEDIDRLLAELKRDIPNLDVCFKTDSRLQQLIGRLVAPFNPHYLTKYTTVMGGKIWLPSRQFMQEKEVTWLYALIRHEAVHLRDMKKYPILFQVSYLLFLPMGLTMRALWEWRAYKVSIQTEFELKGDISDEYIEYVAEQFAGPAYLYMWPFRGHIRRKVQQEKERLVRRAALRRKQSPT